jgi:hypothetical protein
MPVHLQQQNSRFRVLAAIGIVASLIGLVSVEILSPSRTFEGCVAKEMRTSPYVSRGEVRVMCFKR